MKFRVRLIDPRTKKTVKQKTFKCNGWDEAEDKAHEFWFEYDNDPYAQYPTDMSLIVVKE